jgi:hypothetical protein
MRSRHVVDTYAMFAWFDPLGFGRVVISAAVDCTVYGCRDVGSPMPARAALPRRTR